MPERIQRRRAVGWRMPPNTVYVGRGTPWGNPFKVGTHGTQQECAEQFARLMAGYICISRGDYDEQKAVLDWVARNLSSLAGKNLACWCREGTPCHADVLLHIANAPQLGGL